MSRKKAREGLVSLIFKSQFNEKVEDYIIEYYLEDFKFSNDEQTYITSGFEGINKNIEFIDNKISESLETWTIERLYKLDLSILRVAVYEIFFDETVPKEVAINEAVEIAKKFGSKDSSKLINGILGSIIRRNG